MMKKIGNVSADIQNIARILYKNKLCTDISPLTKILGRFKDNSIVHLEKLKLHVDTVPRNTRPIVKSLDILLNVSVPQVASNDLGLSLCGYAFTMEIFGINEEGNRVKSSWHLDYDDTDKAEYVHPYFHLTYGGQAMERIAIGDVLLLPTPRLAYPPMDIVLGIDFALSNFVKKELYESIRQDSQYRAAIINAQMKYWKPYMLILAQFWCKFSCGEFSSCPNQSKHLYPTLLN